MWRHLLLFAGLRFDVSRLVYYDGVGVCFGGFGIAVGFPICVLGLQVDLLW